MLAVRDNLAECLNALRANKLRAGLTTLGLTMGVATLITYAGYVQGQVKYEHRFNPLWLTMLPATYGLLRCIVLLERGTYDDPTELPSRDRPRQAAALICGGLTVFIMLGLPALGGRG